MLRALNALATADDEEQRVDSLLSKAKLLVGKRDREGALREYQGVLNLSPNHLEALRFVTSYLFEAGRLEDALPSAAWHVWKSST